MKYNENKPIFEYPTSSLLTYKNTLPFIRIYHKNHIYYGFYNRNIYIVELHQKPIQSTLLIKDATLPNSNHQYIFKQATKQIKGINYKILYVSKNDYLCIGYLDKIISFVLITIDLNTKGYYEINNIKKVV